MPRAFIFSPWHHLAVLNIHSSNYDPGVKIDSVSEVTHYIYKI